MTRVDPIRQVAQSDAIEYGLRLYTIGFTHLRQTLPQRLSPSLHDV